jgi:hypothetical protein
MTPANREKMARIMKIQKHINGLVVQANHYLPSNSPQRLQERLLSARRIVESDVRGENENRASRACQRPAGPVCCRSG